MQLVLSLEEYHDLVAAINSPKMELGHEFVTKESRGCIIFTNLTSEECTISFKEDK